MMVSSTPDGEAAWGAPGWLGTVTPSRRAVLTDLGRGGCPGPRRRMSISGALTAYDDEEIAEAATAHGREAACSGGLATRAGGLSNGVRGRRLRFSRSRLGR